MANRGATGRWSSSRRGSLALGLLAVLALAPLCRAEGIPLGKFQFYPSLRVGFVQDENLFNQNEAIAAGRVSDRSADLEIPLVLQLPFRASLWELVYTPGLKRFQDNTDLDGDTHRLSTQLNLVFSMGARLNLQGSLTRDYTNLQQAADQLSESQFTFVDYEILRGHAVYEQPFGRRHGMELILDYESLEFDTTELAGFTDFSEMELTLSYVRLLGRDMRVFVGGVGGINDLVQPVLTTRGCNMDATACSRDELIFLAQEQEDRWTRVGVQLGFERQFDEKNRARLDLGYQVLEFDHSEDSKFSGVVAHLRYSRRFSESLSVQADVVRQPTQSSFDVNNYFLMHRATGGVQFQPQGTSLFYFGSLSFQTSAYPDETQLSVNRKLNRRRDDYLGGGFHRRDKIASVDLGVGMQFSALSSLDVTLAARRRDSNLTPSSFGFDDEGEFFLIDRSLDRLDYDDLVIGLTFRYGFIPQRNYI